MVHVITVRLVDAAHKKESIYFNVEDLVESYLKMHDHPRFGKTYSGRKKPDLQQDRESVSTN